MREFLSCFPYGGIDLRESEKERNAGQLHWYMPQPGWDPKLRCVPWPALVRIKPKSATFWCTGRQANDEPPGVGCEGLTLECVPLSCILLQEIYKPKYAEFCQIVHFLKTILFIYL